LLWIVNHKGVRLRWRLINVLQKVLVRLIELPHELVLVLKEQDQLDQSFSIVCLQLKSLILKFSETLLLLFRVVFRRLFEASLVGLRHISQLLNFYQQRFH
jgi:hypothetical protein